MKKQRLTKTLIAQQKRAASASESSEAPTAQETLDALEVAHQEAVQEFMERGHRDITEIVKPVYEQDGGYLYLCTLFSPDGTPVYCRDAKQRQEALTTARTIYPLGTLPYPHEPALWQIIGNFEDE